MNAPHSDPASPVTVNIPADPSVAVTLGEIYKLVLETRDTTLATKAAVDGLRADTDDHETRIRALERKVWIAAGVAAVAGAGAAEAISTALG